jgi:hypothetical protein
MPVAGRTHDIVLKHTDGSSNVVGINLFKESPALNGGYQSEIIPLHPNADQSQTATQQNSYDDVNPNLDLVYEQTSWHRGVGQAQVQRRGIDDFRYASGDGVLSFFEGSLVSGYYEDVCDVIMMNPRFKNADEDGAGLNWTASNLTLSTNIVEMRSGLQCLGVTGSGSSSGTLTQRYGGIATLWRGESLTIRFYARRVSGSGTVRANIIDSNGTTNGTVSSSSSVFAQIEVTRTIHASATTIDFQLEFSTASDVWVIDDGSALPPGGESADFNDNGVVLSNELYVPCGRTIMRWNESDNAFYPVYIDPAYDVECLTEFDWNGASPKLYIGFGTNQVYKSSADGVTWAAPSTVQTNSSRYASFFANVRDANGNFSLAKSTGTEIRISGTDISSNTNNWGAAIPVGSNDKAMNNLLVSNDLLYPGKTDGLYKYDRTNGKFIDLEPEGGQFDHINNYKAGIGRGGKIYAGTGARSFSVITDQDSKVEWDDLSHLVKNETWEGYSGDVESITQDKANIWVALNSQLSTGFPYAFPFNFANNESILDNTRIMCLRPDVDQVTGAQSSTNLIPHTVTTMTATNVQRLVRFVQAGNVDSLFAMGRFTNEDSNDDEARIIRLRIPVDNENPVRSLASQRAVRKRGVFADSWMDWFYPDTPKTLAKIVIHTKNLGGGQSVLVSYKTDDDTPEDDIGWTDLGTAIVSPVATISASLTSPVEFYRLRVKLTLITDDITEAVEVFSYTVHAVFNPIEHTKWTVQSKLSDKKNSRRGRRVRRRSTLSATDLTNLEVLRKEAFCILEDEDGATHRVKIRQIRKTTVESADGAGGESPQKTRIVHLEMNEVRTSS